MEIHFELRGMKVHIYVNNPRFLSVKLGLRRFLRNDKSGYL